MENKQIFWFWMGLYSSAGWTGWRKSVWNRDHVNVNQWEIKKQCNCMELSEKINLWWKGTEENIPIFQGNFGFKKCYQFWRNGTNLEKQCRGWYCCTGFPVGWDYGESGQKGEIPTIWYGDRLYGWGNDKDFSGGRRFWYESFEAKKEDW